MATVLAAASYSRIGFSLCLDVRAWRVRVPGGSAFHLEPGTIQHMTHFSDLRRKEFPKMKFLSDLVEDIKSWK